MKPHNLKAGLLILYFLILVVSCIHPIYPREMYLQHSATIIAGAFLIYITIKNNLSNQAFVLIFAFMILHIIGARWIYTYTPYDSWIKSLTGFSINDCFGWERNQYDRFLHLMFGFLLLIPASEIYHRWLGVPAKRSDHIAFLFILAGSLFYEVFEWFLTLVLSPEQADSYNGQQGDFWDAQKDMALAMLGALIMIVIRRIAGIISGHPNQD